MNPRETLERALRDPKLPIGFIGPQYCKQLRKILTENSDLVYVSEWRLMHGTGYECYMHTEEIGNELRNLIEKGIQSGGTITLIHVYTRQELERIIEEYKNDTEYAR